MNDNYDRQVIRHSGSFPLTDLQEAYLVGRQADLELGGVALHFYFEVDARAVDLQRLERAWNALVARHEMLRAVVLAEGEQEILEQVPYYRIPILDLGSSARQETVETLRGLRDRLSHRVLEASRWPVFDLRATRVGEDQIRVHLSLDGLLVDMRSRQRLFREWGVLYEDPETVLPAIQGSFRDFISAYLARKNTDEYRAARQYWLERLDDLPGPPELPVPGAARQANKSRFHRVSRRLAAEAWTAFQARARELQVRPSVALLTAFSDVLGLWSTTPRFMVNLTIVDDAARRPGLDGVVGDFTANTLLVVDTRGELSFSERCAEVQRQLAQDLAHSAFTGVEVARELARRSGSRPGPAAPVVFTSVLSDPGSRDDALGWLGRTVYEISQTPQVTLDLQLSEQGGELVSNFDVVRDRFPPHLPDEIARAYANYLGLLADHARHWRQSSSLLRRGAVPGEHQAIRDAANANRQTTGPHALHALVEEQAKRTPDRPAVIASNRVLDYRELTLRARRLGAAIRARGIARDQLVAVALDKGWEQIVATLGVLYSGAAYLPLDPHLPRRRLRHLLELGDARLAITSGALSDRLDWDGAPDLLYLADGSGGGPTEAPPCDGGRPDSLAYVIFTSGTTGDPKGVMIEHRAVANTITALASRFCLDAEDRVLALSPLGFDLSVFDLFGPLSTGGAVVVPPPSPSPDPDRWRELLERHHVTTWNTTPELMEVLVEHLAHTGQLLPSSLRLVLLSGDRIPVSLPARIHALHPTVEVCSLGGATEASIWSILHSIQRVDPNWSSIPYGRALPGQEIDVVTEDLEPRPLWAVGEIAIAGKGLARGYWKDPERTAKSFVADQDGRRLYLTGDLGRIRPDGNVEILGRKDHQAKIRGFRVEPAEVEAAILQHAGVRATVVTTVDDGTGSRQLAAYVVPAGSSKPAEEEVRSFLAERLPAYMVPRFVSFLDELPMTINAKVDRSALPSPLPPEPGDATEGRLPEADLETRICRIIEELLGIRQLGVETNFLDAGGDSLDMMRLSLKLEGELGVHLRMDSLYAEPTARALARRCRAFMSDTEAPAGERLRALLDPSLRESFKKEQPGIRDDLDAGYVLPRPRRKVERVLRRLDSSRRSVRHFRAAPVPLRDLADLLGALRQRAGDGQPTYLYASAGGLYPLQLCVYVKPGRVHGLPGGSYYYHPVRHELQPLNGSSNLDLASDAYDPSFNRGIFERSAFAMFLVAELAAIEPVYGRRSWHYAVLEAGLVSQLLESAAATTRLGLCQIGELDYDHVNRVFGLNESQRIVHSLVGGLAESKVPPSAEPGSGARGLVSAARHGGQDAPVFCLPGAGGFPIRIHALAGQLGNAQPIHVVRYPGLYDGEEPAASVEELARRIRSEALPRLRGRPWRLIGFSFGGVVAFEMARQAMAEGEEVALLALVDTAAPDYLRTHPDKVESILTTALSKYERAGESAGDESLPSREGIWKTTHASIDAQCRYHPGPFHGHIFLVRAADSRADVEDGFDCWEPFAAGGSTTVWVPGDKSSKFKSARLEELGRQLRRILEN